MLLQTYKNKNSTSTNAVKFTFHQTINNIQQADNVLHSTVEPNPLHCVDAVRCAARVSVSLKIENIFLKPYSLS